MIVKTEAIVLRSMKYRETSKIVRLYTRRYGKISVIAKGARDSKNRFGSALEPMNYVSTVVYKKDNRDLHLLSQCDMVRPFRLLSEDMERMSAAMAVIELIDAVTHSEEENEPLFTLVLRVLEAINNATKNSITALYFFEMRLSEILGFRPNFQRCSVCSGRIDLELLVGEHQEMQVGPTGILCKACEQRGIGSRTISLSGVSVLQQLQESDDLDEVMRISIDARVGGEVGSALRQHLHSHVDGLRRLKSEKVFATIS
ncbi:MAG: DNA repair protein RecO [Ignavibacteriae bacterium]|nr:DNA repair protein RecO [Ignavibacteriota bacterium]